MGSMRGLKKDCSVKTVARVTANSTRQHWQVTLLATEYLMMKPRSNLRSVQG